MAFLHHHHSRANFNTLPTETISAIFVFSLPPDLKRRRRPFAANGPDGPRITRNIEPLKLLSVCKRWYDVAQGTPPLWRRICLGDHTRFNRAAQRVRRDSEGIDYFVQRAGALKLDIRLDYEFLSVLVGMQPIHDADAAEFEEVKVEVAAMIHKVGGLNERIQRLDLAFNSQLVPCGVDAFTSVAFPTLETLNLHGYSFDDVQIVLSRLPSLKHLTLRGTGLHLRLLDTQSSNGQTVQQDLVARAETVLESLTLIDCMSPRELIQTLTSQTPLRVVNLAVEFDLVTGGFPGGGFSALQQMFEGAFHFPSIKTLKIIDPQRRGYHALCLLGVLRLPSLEHLEIGGSTRTAMHLLMRALAIFIQYSGNPPLKTIRLGEDWHVLEDTPVMDWMQVMLEHTTSGL